MIKFLKNLFGPAPNLENIIANGALILDVRTKNEFDSGHIKNSKNIPVDSINKQLETIKKNNKPVITVCRSGSRSAMAKSILKNAGIEAYNGGAWQSFKNKYALK